MKLSKKRCAGNTKKPAESERRTVGDYHLSKFEAVVALQNVAGDHHEADANEILQAPKICQAQRLLRRE